MVLYEVFIYLRKYSISLNDQNTLNDKFTDSYTFQLYKDAYLIISWNPFCFIFNFLSNFIKICVKLKIIETKKVFKILTLLSANLGGLKKDEKFCEKDAMWQTVPEMKNDAYKFSFALKQLLPVFSHKMS